MNVAAAGQLIIFFSLLIGLVLISLIVFAYAAYSFLTVLTNTAAGNDEVVWPGDPIQDWFFKVWYLGWLVALWIVPATFIVSLLNVPRPLSAVCLAGVLWFIFPVSLLSSLSASTHFAVVRPVIVRLLLKRLGATLRFYGSTAVVVLVCGGLVYAAAFGLRFLSPPMGKGLWVSRHRVISALDQPILLVPLGAVAGAVGCLIYARLLGRMAYLISPSRAARGNEDLPCIAGEVQNFDPWSAAEWEEAALASGLARSEDKPRRKKRKTSLKQPGHVHDPWAPPAEEPTPKVRKPIVSSVPEDPYGPAEGTYELVPDGTPPTPAPPSSNYSGMVEEPPEPYGLAPDSERAPSRLPEPAPLEVSRKEAELAAPRRLPPLPEWPFVTGIYSFPFYPQSRGPFGTLAIGFLGVAAMLRLLFSWFPV